MPTTARPHGRLGHERRGVRRRLGPARRAIVGRLPAASGRKRQTALGQHPLQLLVEQEQRGQRRRVVGLVEAAVLEGDRQVERGRHPAPARLDAPDPLDGGGRQQREPQPAVGGEDLLRGEVVDVDLGRRSTGGRRPPTWRRRAPGRRRRRGRSSGIITPGRRLVVGEGVDVDVGFGLRPRVGAGRRVDDRRVAQTRAPRRRRPRTSTRTRRTRGAGSRAR